MSKKLHIAGEGVFIPKKSHVEAMLCIETMPGGISSEGLCLMLGLKPRKGKDWNYKTNLYRLLSPLIKMGFVSRKKAIPVKIRDIVMSKTARIEARERYPNIELPSEKEIMDILKFNLLRDSKEKVTRNTPLETGAKYHYFLTAKGRMFLKLISV